MVKSGVLEVNWFIDWSVFGKTSKKEIPQISVCGISSCLILTEGVGFEPTMRLPHNGFQDRALVAIATGQNSSSKQRCWFRIWTITGSL